MSKARKNASQDRIFVRMQADGRWSVSRNDNKKMICKENTQKAAIARARAVAKERGIPMAICNIDGDIRRVYYDNQQDTQRKDTKKDTKKVVKKAKKAAKKSQNR